MAQTNRYNSKNAISGLYQRPFERSTIAEKAEKTMKRIGRNYTIRLKSGGKPKKIKNKKKNICIYLIHSIDKCYTHLFTYFYI